jgi:DNA-binding NtrC family response regulator
MRTIISGSEHRRIVANIYSDGQIGRENMNKNNPGILIIDDDRHVLTTMGDILRLKGYHPEFAQTGQEAFARMAEQHFNVALVDLRLEDMSGMEVLRYIKLHAPDTRCILLTGHASQNSAIQAVQLGAYGYFQKPFDIDQVLLSIQRAVEIQVAEETVTQAERRFKALIEKARDGVILFTADQKMVDASPSAK